MTRRNMNLRTDGFIRNIHSRNPFDVIRADVVLARIEKQANRACGLHYEIYESRLLGIDPVAADMAFIQLSLLGIAAEVVTGNTLTMTINRVRYTPVYYLNDFEKRLADLGRFRAMRDFLRGIQEAA
ncbi:hypothetical protein ACI2JR_28125 [Klebsiella sp. NPDC088457]